MAIHASRASTWPAKIAYASAGIFSLASAGTNTLYGWSRGADIASSMIWASVALAVSLAFTLTWPATMAALRNRDWPAAAMCTVGLVLFGTFSVAGALGSASSGRVTAEMLESDTAAAKRRAQVAYDAAQMELATLASSRTVGEVEAALATAKPTCRVVVTEGRRDSFCTPNAALTAELARAKRRAELQKQVQQAGDALTVRPAKPANSDSRALAKYLQALGMNTTPQLVTDLLVLLAVLVVEFGGGLSLALGMALTSTSAQVHRTEAPSSEPTERPAGGELRITATSAGAPAIVVRHTPVGLADPTESDIERLLRSDGPVVGLRQLAGKLGRPKSTVADECHRLAGAGRLRLAKAGRSMRIELASRPH